MLDQLGGYHDVGPPACQDFADISGGGWIGSVAGRTLPFCETLWLSEGELFPRGGRAKAHDASAGGRRRLVRLSGRASDADPNTACPHFAPPLGSERPGEAARRACQPSALAGTLERSFSVVRIVRRGEPPGEARGPLVCARGLSDASDGYLRCAMPDEHARVEAIRGWFEERGYELTVLDHDGSFIAAYMLPDSSSGAGGTGTGATALEAAEAARRHLQAIEMR